MTRADELKVLIQEAELHLDALKKERAQLLKDAHPIQPGAILRWHWGDRKRAVVTELRVGWHDYVIPYGHRLKANGERFKGAPMPLHGSTWEPAK